MNVICTAKLMLGHKKVTQVRNLISAPSDEIRSYVLQESHVPRELASRGVT